jgi:CheY-like chemotaxis protein
MTAPLGPADHLVLIDDEPQLLTSLSRLLRGVDVVTFSAPSAALAHLAQGGPCDAVVCDVMMPSMTGPDFHRCLAAVRPDLAQRTVFMTGGALGAEVKRFLAGFAVPPLDKPFTLEELTRAVRALPAQSS